MLIRRAKIVHLTSDLNENHYVLPSKISIYPKNIIRRAKNDDLNGEVSFRIMFSNVSMRRQLDRSLTAADRDEHHPPSIYLLNKNPSLVALGKKHGFMF